MLHSSPNKLIFHSQTYKLFDLVCGTSTGAILAFAVGIKRYSLMECEAMYKGPHLVVRVRACSYGAGHDSPLTIESATRSVPGRVHDWIVAAHGRADVKPERSRSLSAAAGPAAGPRLAVDVVLVLVLVGLRLRAALGHHARRALPQYTLGPCRRHTPGLQFRHRPGTSTVARECRVVSCRVMSLITHQTNSDAERKDGVDLGEALQLHEFAHQVH